MKLCVRGSRGSSGGSWSGGLRGRGLVTSVELVACMGAGGGGCSNEGGGGDGASGGGGGGGVWLGSVGWGGGALFRGFSDGKR